MKKTATVLLACAACCAFPFVAAAVAGFGATGFTLAFAGAEIAVVAGVAAVAAVALVWHRRRTREGAACAVPPAREG